MCTFHIKKFTYHISQMSKGCLLGASRLSQITSVRLLIAPFGHVTAFSCPLCQYYQCSSLNRPLWRRHDFHNMSTLSILPVIVSQSHSLGALRLSQHVHIVRMDFTIAEYFRFLRMRRRVGSLCFGSFQIGSSPLHSTPLPRSY